MTHTASVHEGPMRRLRVPRRLIVPCFAGPCDARPLGTGVEAGDRLTSTPAPVAPMSGRIAGMIDAELLGGSSVSAVMIETGAQGEESPATSGAQPVEELLSPIGREDLEQWIAKIERAGVWASRWASPDLPGQMRQCVERKPDLLICNALDADNALPLQRLVTTTFGRDVIAGAALLARLVGAKDTWVVTDDTPSATIDSVVAQLAQRISVRLVRTRNDYPSMNPTLLLHTLTRRRLPPGELPPAKRAVILDAVAAMKLGELLRTGRVSPWFPMALHDSGTGRSHFLSVMEGSPLEHILHECQLSSSLSALALRVGAPLRNLRTTPAAVASCGGELTVYASRPITHLVPEPCIRSGWCVESCPVRIHPPGLLEAAQRNNKTLADWYGLDACIECGICTYVCPSNLPLLSGIREIRKNLRTVGETPLT